LRLSRRRLWGMPSCGMWRRVGILYTDVSEERVASVVRVEEITLAKKSVCYQPSNTFPRLRYFSCPEDGGDTFLRNVGLYYTHMAPPHKTALFIINTSWLPDSLRRNLRLKFICVWPLNSLPLYPCSKTLGAPFHAYSLWGKHSVFGVELVGWFPYSHVEALQGHSSRWRHQCWVYALDQYATNRKVAGSKPDEVNF
jgi:hypothetical protein